MFADRGEFVPKGFDEGVRLWDVRWRDLEPYAHLAARIRQAIARASSSHQGDRIVGILHVVGTFPSIDPAKLSEFKKVAAQAVEVAKHEEATLQYEYFMSADETACVVLETYASSEALLAHMAGGGSVHQRLFELGGDLKADMFGEPSPGLLEATAAFKPKIYASIAANDRRRSS